MQRAAACVSIGALVLTACSSSATGTLIGGEPRFDATPPFAPPTGSDDGGGGGDGGGGNTWTDLYRDYFGPTGSASCERTTTCHGSTSGTGYISSGFLCAPDQAGCFKGISSPTAALLTDSNGQPTTNFPQTTLYSILRKSSGGGNMPNLPVSFAFSDGDISRMAAWFAAGAKND